ncbi:MAG TPA: hypothetical protein VNZ64_28185 [Candidatus Acidoferrum sp.]|nr:hypothetical protein [Candidatus Acidoferrum sp.]
MALELILPTAAQDAAARPDIQSRAPPAQQPARPSASFQGRQHPSYQVFSSHAVLPSVTILDERSLDVAGEIRIEVRRPDLLSSRQKLVLAALFGVPVAVPEKALRGFSSEGPVAPEQAAQQLRMTIIDYKYLRDAWTRYRPPAGMEQLKNTALLSLEAGEIDKAWEMYMALPRPQPPQGLRLAGR